MKHSHVKTVTLMLISAAVLVYLLAAVVPSYYNCLGSGGAPVEAFPVYKCAVVK